MVVDHDEPASSLPFTRSKILAASPVYKNQLYLLPSDTSHQPPGVDHNSQGGRVHIQRAFCCAFCLDVSSKAGSGDGSILPGQSLSATVARREISSTRSLCARTSTQKSNNTQKMIVLPNDKPVPAKTCNLHISKHFICPCAIPSPLSA